MYSAIDIICLNTLKSGLLGCHESIVNAYTDINFNSQFSGARLVPSVRIRCRGRKEVKEVAIFLGSEWNKTDVDATQALN